MSNAPKTSPPVEFWRQAGGRLASALGPLLALLAVAVTFGVAVVAHDRENTFFTLESFRLIASETSKLAIPALGMTVIVIAGGIDLSAGMAIALSAVIMATTLKDGWPPSLALAAAMLTGILVGLANGLLVSSLRLAPFIATLGM